MGILSKFRPVLSVCGFAEMDHDSAMEEFYEEYEGRSCCADHDSASTVACVLLGIALSISAHS